MSMKLSQDEFDEPPPVPEHQEPEVPLRTTSMARNRLSPQSMLKKQPAKPILKNKGKKVGDVLDVEIHIDNNEPGFDNIVLKSPKTVRKKKTDGSNPESSRKSKLGAILKPILKKEIVHNEKVNDNFKQFPVKERGNVLLLPKSLQKVSDVETSDTDTEKTRKKHVRITEPGNTPDENDLTKNAIINHYSDLVKEYGTKEKKVLPKMILTHDELKAKAIESESNVSVDWDSVAEPNTEHGENESYGLENVMKDPFSDNRIVPEQNVNIFGNEPMRESFMSIKVSPRVNNYNTKQVNEAPAKQLRDRTLNSSRLAEDRNNRRIHDIQEPPQSTDNTQTSQVVPYARIAQKRIHSYFDYTIDVLVFGIACWIYFFKHPILCVPILLLLICKQIYENRESFLFWKNYYKQYEQTPPE